MPHNNVWYVKMNEKDGIFITEKYKINAQLSVDKHKY